MSHRQTGSSARTVVTCCSQMFSFASAVFSHGGALLRRVWARQLRLPLLPLLVAFASLLWSCPVAFAWNASGILTVELTEAVLLIVGLLTIWSAWANELEVPEDPVMTEGSLEEEVETSDAETPAAPLPTPDVAEEKGASQEEASLAREDTAASAAGPAAATASVPASAEAEGPLQEEERSEGQTPEQQEEQRTPEPELGPDDRIYVVWIIPGAPEATGIHLGKHPHLWDSLKAKMPGGGYRAGRGVHLRRCYTRRSAVLLYRREADRHRVPKEPRWHR